MHTIGIVEVTGAIALLLPRLCAVAALAIAALAFVALMRGATGRILAHTGIADAAGPAHFLEAPLAITAVMVVRRGGTRALSIWPRDRR
jgi:hypothetical protein